MKESWQGRVIANGVAQDQLPGVELCQPRALERSFQKSASARDWPRPLGPSHGIGSGSSYVVQGFSPRSHGRAREVLLI